jgi:uncharacterized protein (DUF2336 family)
MYHDWPAWIVFALGLGLGIALALALTLPLLSRAWGAYRREQELASAHRVAGMVKDIITTRESEVLDPYKQRDLAEAARDEYEKLRDSMNRSLARWEKVRRDLDEAPTSWKGKTQ